MNNTIDSSNICTKTNALIIGAAGTVGALGGIAKTNFIDIPDVKKGLKEEYQKFLDNVSFNNKTIKDEFVRETTNQKLASRFDKLREYCCNEGMKKVNRKNIIGGTLIGVAAGIAGVAVKILLGKKKGAANEINTNKVQSCTIPKQL